MANKTIFEKILAGEIPCDKVFENEHVLAFHDISPQAPVHVLVVPKIKWISVADLATADPTAVGRFMAGISRTAAQLGLEKNGYRVVFNTGRDALQSVDYLHAHIIAGRKLAWPPG